MPTALPSCSCHLVFPLSTFQFNQWPNELAPSQCVLQHQIHDAGEQINLVSAQLTCCLQCNSAGRTLRNALTLARPTLVVTKLDCCCLAPARS